MELITTKIFRVFAAEFVFECLRYTLSNSKLMENATNFWTQNLQCSI